MAVTSSCLTVLRREGSSGVVVNTVVTRSGANRPSCRALRHSQDADLNATNDFLKIAGNGNPEASSKVVDAAARRPRTVQLGVTLYGLNTQFVRQRSRP